MTYLKTRYVLFNITVRLI